MSGRDWSSVIEYSVAASACCGGIFVPHYRIYDVSPDGHVLGPPKLIECDNDQEATQKAAQTVDGFDVEVWCRDRRIALLPRKTL